MDEILAALAEQLAELRELLEGLDDAGWAQPSRCEGWTVADVVIHLAQTNDLAVASAGGSLWGEAEQLGWGEGRASSVDDAAAFGVEQERGLPPRDLLARWQASADAMHAAIASHQASDRLPWVAGQLSARTLATTRLAESWIHTGDVAHAFGIAPQPTERLRHIARLAWRTLPYAFASAGRAPLAGPVELHLGGPGGVTWSFTGDDGPAVTTIEGAALDWCLLAARRAEPSDTGLRGTGPDADAVLELVRTYA